mmetsp:Transcript_9699/g.7320  ORF Transcript_9699/g.7320 Transcript_9699/m.7320 type:complete len:106 (+) Transcript_9699:747-1064(+)
MKFLTEYLKEEKGDINLRNMLAIMEGKLRNQRREKALLIEGIILKAKKIMEFKHKDEEQKETDIPEINIAENEQLKIVAKMHRKYADILEYFRESKMDREVTELV